MSSPRNPSPARSQGAVLSPRHKTPRRTRSVGSPALSNASGRLSSMIQEYRDQNLGSFVLSPMVRRSVLTDNTDIEEPRRKSWWKKLENSRDVMEVMEVIKTAEPVNIFEELNVEVLSPEKKNYTLDLPESSDSESINSIVIPHRKLFTEKENVPKKIFGQFGTRDTLSKLHKTNATTDDKAISTKAKELFPNKVHSKPIFPAALLIMSPDKTSGDKTLMVAEPKGHVRNIFGNRQGTKRKNMFANFIMSESEDEIPETQQKIFEFQKKPEMTRRPGSFSRCLRDASSTSSITTDMELDDWKLLPSSTMVETQLEAVLASGQTPKRAKLSKLSEAKESDTGTNSTGNRTKQSSKSTVSKNKSKTIAKEKSELNMSVSTRNRSQVSHDEAVQLNQSQANQHKSKSTSPRNNDNISQSSIVTRSRNKSGLIDTIQNTSIKKTQNNTSKTKNTSKDSPKQTKKDDEASITNNHRSTAKNSSKSLSSVQKQNVVNVGKELDPVDQNDDDELNFTLEYENDDIADEIDVAKESNQQNSVIFKSNKKTNYSHLNSRNVEEATNEVINNEVILDQQVNNENRLQNKSQNKQENKKVKENEVQVDEVEQNMFVNENKGVENESQAKDNESKQSQSEEIIKQNKARGEEEQNKSQESDNQIKELAKDDESNKSGEQSREINHKNDREEENDSNYEEKEVEQKILEDDNEDMGENQDVQNESQEEQNVSEEIQNESQGEHNESEELQNESKEEHNESEEIQNESQGEHNESEELQNESQEEHNESEEIQNESQGEHNESEELQNESQEEHNESQGEHNESEELQNESQEEHNESEEEQNESEEIQNESQEQHNESEEKQNESEEIQNESQEIQNESQEAQNESEEENNSREEQIDIENEQNESQEEHNESQEVQNETEEEENESETERDNQENEESQEISENELQNSSQEEIEQTISVEANQEMYCDAANDSSDEEATESDQEGNQGIESDQEAESVQNDNNQEENSEEIDTDTHNVSQDTTGKNRKKNESPEMILHDTTNQAASFAVHGRNTSVRKTKSMIRNFTARHSLKPVRNSVSLSDGTKNSSVEGSGWDSHRTTRKTLRQTFGKEFTPRKSLRTWVMEKSAKMQTMADDVTSVTAKFPQANSTEFPEESSNRDDYVEMNDEPEQSDHEVSRRTRQTMLEMYLQKIQKQNMENRTKMEEAVRNSLKASPGDALNPFKVPTRPMFPRRQISKTAKPKAKLVKSFIPLEDLPEEVIQDMKYKPPKRFQPRNAPWVTKRLYKYLETKLEPKYDYKARIRSERLVETLYQFAKDLRRQRVASIDSVDFLKREMARLDIVKTHFEFYDFFHEFMPREIRIKVIPDVVNEIPVPRNGVFADILE